jgi:hypothetical protein
MGTGAWHIDMTKDGVKMKAKGKERTWGWTGVKCEFAPEQPDSIILWLDPATKFVLIPSIPKEDRIGRCILNVRPSDFLVVAIEALANKSRRRLKL